MADGTAVGLIALVGRARICSRLARVDGAADLRPLGVMELVMAGMVAVSVCLTLGFLKHIDDAIVSRP